MVASLRGLNRGTKYRSLHRNVARCCDSQHRNYPRNPALKDRFSTGLRPDGVPGSSPLAAAVILCSMNSAAAATRGPGHVGCVSRGKLSREKDSVGFWWVRVGTPFVCLALAAAPSLGMVRRKRKRRGAEVRKPNILVIMTDDQTAASVWAMRAVSTKLSALGTRFSHAFAT